MSVRWSAFIEVGLVVDAFNLCYGCLEGTPYRWLALAALCRRLLPNDEINRIRYFTALVSARPDDPKGRSASSPTFAPCGPSPT